MMDVRELHSLVPCDAFRFERDHFGQSVLQFRSSPEGMPFLIVR
jgi:hypothetical protein